MSNTEKHFDTTQLPARRALVARLEGFRVDLGRMMLFCVLSANGRSDEEREKYRDLVDRTRETVTAIVEIMDGSGAVEDTDRSALTWIRQKVSRNQDLGRLCRVLTAGIERMVGIDAPQAPDVANTVLEITETTQDLFDGPFAEFISELWSDLNEAQSERGSHASEAAQSAQSSMAKIANISRSVRLISLNASVEAARVGDLGRGFSVIAGEIKSLAEAIDQASQSATSSMNQLVTLVDTR